MKTICANVLASLVLLSAAAIADTDVRSVTVDGRAWVDAEPDLALVRMAIQVRDRNMQVARSEVNSVTRDFLRLAGREGIDEARVQTSGATILPEYRWNSSNNRQELQGYLVQRDITVELDDIGKLGDLLEGAVDLGVNQVYPAQLKNSRERDLRREALAAAARDAEATARQLAETLGVTLGTVREIVATDVREPRPLQNERIAMAASGDQGGADTYNTGEIRIEARVTARFDLLDTP